MTVGQRAAETPDSRMRGCDVRVEEAQEAEEVQEVQEVERHKNNMEREREEP